MLMKFLHGPAYFYQNSNAILDVQVGTITRSFCGDMLDFYVMHSVMLANIIGKVEDKQ